MKRLPTTLNRIVTPPFATIATIGLFFTALIYPSIASDKPVSTKESAPVAPPVPPIESISVEPASLELHDGRDARRVLVWGKTRSGEMIDLTSHAAFKAGSETVETRDGYVLPKAKGNAEVTVTAAGASAKLPVKVLSADVPAIGFVRDVMPILSKVGCNAGTCHGAAKGKNGFKLSLRGYDPDFDYHALITDISGRRFNRVNADESLMLLKPTGEVPHEGRQVIKPSSREYQVLRQWIAEGCKAEEPSRRANKLEVLPREIILSLPGMSQNVVVLAHYPDGKVRDVTRDAVLSSNNEEIAKVQDNVVTGIRRGEAAPRSSAVHERHSPEQFDQLLQSAPGQ